MSAVPAGVGPGDEFEVLLDDVEASEQARIVTEDDQMIEGETASRICRACCGMRKHARPCVTTYLSCPFLHTLTCTLVESKLGSANRQCVGAVEFAGREFMVVKETGAVYEQLDGAPVEVGQWDADAQRIVFSTSPVASPEAAGDEEMR